MIERFVVDLEQTLYLLKSGLNITNFDVLLHVQLTWKFGEI